MDALLAEMLREAERAVDRQLTVLAELDDKSEQLLAVTLATLGAGLALFGFAADWLPTRVDPGFKAVVGLAVAANLSSLLAVLSGYVGAAGPAERFAGPSPAWLREKANLADWTLERHMVTAIGGVADSFRHNAALMDAHRKAHSLGLLLLTAGVLLYAVAALYVVW